jgi:hypothetical protein
MRFEMEVEDSSPATTEEINRLMEDVEELLSPSVTDDARIA